VFNVIVSLSTANLIEGGGVWRSLALVKVVTACLMLPPHLSQLCYSFNSDAMRGFFLFSARAKFMSLIFVPIIFLVFCYALLLRLCARSSWSRARSSWSRADLMLPRAHRSLVNFSRLPLHTSHHVTMIWTRHRAPCSRQWFDPEYINSFWLSLRDLAVLTSVPQWRHPWVS